MRLLTIALAALALAISAAADEVPPHPATARPVDTGKRTAKTDDTQPAAPKPAADKQPDAKPACRLCGGRCGLTPVCVCEPATQKKPKTTYSIRCEPVCVPTPKLLGCGHGHTASCTGQPCDGGCAAATVRTKKSLLKTITEVEVDVMNRKVEYICHHCSGAEPPAGCVSCTGRESPTHLRQPWWPWTWPWTLAH